MVKWMVGRKNSRSGQNCILQWVHVALSRLWANATASWQKYARLYAAYL